MSARDALDESLARIDRFDDPAIVVGAVPPAWLRDLAEEIDAKPAQEVPLRGTTFAVKDNIDVAGTPTTAACPPVAFVPDRSATVVERLIAAGALPVAKVNLDQFATGLVGTRSPFGTPRNPYRSDLVPGGSSSGSGVAVARSLTTFSLGTDTAGSGRVPAAMCGIVGVKPTPGRVSTHGVIPAVRSVDCVSVFAGEFPLAQRVLDAASAFDPADPYSRRPGPAAPSVRTVGTVAPELLADLGVDPVVVAGYRSVIESLPANGLAVHEFDPSDLFAIGDQLYGGPWVSERLVTLDHFGPPAASLDPAVASILAAARRHTATDVHRAHDAVASLRHSVDALFEHVDAVALPTIGWFVTLEELARDGLEPNTRLGRFTTFTNLANLAAVAFPVAEVEMPDELPPFSLSLHGPAWSDRALAHAAARIAGMTPPEGAAGAGILLAVAGAHLRGQPLEHQLVDRGARFVATTRTAACYRLHAIANTTPPKPALVHTGPADGAAIEVDLWEVSAGALGEFLASIPAPLGIGTVELADGSTVTGFIAEPRALDGATDITRFGGWRAYRAASVH